MGAADTSPGASGTAGSGAETTSAAGWESPLAEADGAVSPQDERTSAKRQTVVFRSFILILALGGERTFSSISNPPELTPDQFLSIEFGSSQKWNPLKFQVSRLFSNLGF
jgi:hypothetical protein